MLGGLDSFALRNVKRLHARSLDIINAKGSAIGNGVADDAPPIQAALNTISAGGACWIPGGTYVLGKPVTFAGKCHLYGDGIGVTTLKLKNGFSANSQMLDTNSKSNITISDITFDGNAAGQTFAGDNGQIGVLVRTSSDVIVKDCLFKDWGKDGVEVYSDATPGTYCQNVRVDGCTFENIRRCGVTIISGKHIRVVNNTFRGSAVTTAVTNGGVTWEPDVANDVLSDLIVANNSFNDMLAGCRLANVAGLSTAEKIVIDNNTFSNITGEAGVVVYKLYSGGATIANNRFDTCGKRNDLANVYAQGGGINFSYSDCVFITGNWFKSCTSYAFTDLAFGGTVYSTDGNSFVHICDNSFYYDDTHGISLNPSVSGFGGTYRQITGNTFVKGGQGIANTFTAVRVNNQNANKGSSDRITGNIIVTSTVDGYGTGISVNYDDGTSLVGQNKITGNGVFNTFTNGTPQAAVEEVPWTDYSATSVVTGWAATPTVHIWYSKVGKKVFCRFAISGTSNAVGASFTLPYATRATGFTQYQAGGFAQDNGASLAPPCQVELLSNSATFAVYPSGLLGPWTNVNAKQCQGEFWYETTD